MNIWPLVFNNPLTFYVYFTAHNTPRHTPTTPTPTDLSVDENQYELGDPYPNARQARDKGWYRQTTELIILQNSV